MASTLRAQIRRSRIGPVTDREKVERARRGDLDAFESIVRDRMPGVYRMCLAITTNELDAADAAQDAFVAAWRQIRGLRDPARFDAWLHRIVVNAARMTLRSRRRRMIRELVSPNAGTSTVDAADAADALAVAEAFRELPVEHRALLAAHHLDGRSIDDLALLYGVPPGTVKSRLFAARRALREALERESGA